MKFHANAYAVFGSTEIPKDTLILMDRLGDCLAHKGLTLRSGAEHGASEAFERGCDRAGGKKELFIPWDGFNKRKANTTEIAVGNQQLGSRLAARYLKNWRHLNPQQRLQMARVAFVMLGADTRSPVRFVMYWGANDPTPPKKYNEHSRPSQKYSRPIPNIHL